MDISTQMFRSWQKDAVTIEMMEMLELGIEHIKEQMLNPDIIEENDSRAKIHRLLGYMEALEFVRDIHITTEEEYNADGADRV